LGERDHRFPPPWTVEEQDACFVVRDHNGQQLAYVYFEDEPGRRYCKSDALNTARSIEGQVIPTRHTKTLSPELLDDILFKS
jgi:hypothetical protein